MTIADNYAPIRQIGNGSTTQFYASWSMIAASYADVYLEDAATGVLTGPLTQGAGANQYTIIITSSGFTVTFNTAPTSSQYAVIGRKTAKTQTDSYRTSKGFQGEVEENSFDKLTAMVQEITSTLGRNISAPLGDTASLQMPNATLRANSFLGFDASGNVKVYSGVSGTAISTAMTPVVQASTLPLARTAMGVAGSGANSDITALNGLSALKINSKSLITQVVIQKFTSSGTYTPTSGLVYAIIEAWGGGGGGAGCAVTGGTNGSAGGGGGAGGYSKSISTAATIGSSQTVTIGAAGSAGTSGGGNGGAGGTTSVGTICIANGGSGGFAGSAGGAGGTSGTGNAIAVAGQYGGWGLAVGNGNVGAIGGYGGSTSVGGGGAQVYVVGGSASVQGSGYGAGGGGAAASLGGAAYAGAIGQAGLVVVTEFISA